MKKISKVLYVLLILFFINILANNTYSNMLDDVLGFFGGNKKSEVVETTKLKETNKETVVSIDKIENDEKTEIEQTVESIYKNLINCNFDELLDKVNNADSISIDSIKSFFNEYDGAVDKCKKILSYIKYEIVSTNEKDNYVYVKLNIITPDFDKVIDKLIPKIALKVMTKMALGTIDNDTINFIISSLYDVLENNNFDTIKNTYEFKFIKVNDGYFLCDVNKVLNDCKSYFTSYLNKILKFK